MKNDPYIVTAFLKAKEMESAKTDGTLPIVTISRQVGALGEEVAYRTAEILSEMNHGKHPWIVVDKDVGERVVADHHLPLRLSKFFSGEETLSIDNYIHTLMGISVPGNVVIKSLTKTIIQLARLGHVILVGRAAHIITAKFPRAAHVRMIASFDRRVERVAASQHCSPSEAATKIKTVEHLRRHFVSAYFHADLEDSSRYDMILNTSRLSVEECAQSVAQLVSNSHFREKESLQLQELRHQVLGLP